MRRKISQKSLIEKLSQAMSPEMQQTDSWNSSDAVDYSQPNAPTFDGTMDEAVQQGLLRYIELEEQQVDYIEIAHTLREELGPELATTVMEIAVETDMVAPPKQAEIKTKTFFAFSNDEGGMEIFDEYELEGGVMFSLQNDGYVPIGRYITNSFEIIADPSWKPPFEDPAWEWFEETQKKDPMPTGFVL
jgi:hypothetical protein